jgi:hypothetical protein
MERRVAISHEVDSLHSAMRWNVGARVGKAVRRRWRTRNKRRSRRKRRKLLNASAAARYYFDTLHAPAGAPGTGVTKAARIGEEDIRRFGLGFARITGTV